MTVLDQIDELHGVSKANVGQLETYAGELKSTIQGMIGARTAAQTTMARMAKASTDGCEPVDRDSQAGSATACARRRGSWHHPGIQDQRLTSRACVMFADMTRAIIICLLVALSSAHARAEEMLASWYGFESGTVTASGARFNPHAMTCAYWYAPFGTILRVTYQGKPMLCTVNDRGPAKWTGRGIDLSMGMAEAIGLKNAGVGRVTVERVN
jgi:rare lipoprotein A (peptidoglycan hydrolase)